jgi:hypothetical protein
MAKYIPLPKKHECTWRAGPPPRIGWWPASKINDPTSLRWWNGKYWSESAHHTCPSPRAAQLAGRRDISVAKLPIRWTAPWWPTQYITPGLSSLPKPVFWRGEDGGWACARPLPPPYPSFKHDWWKRSGIRGFGRTKAQALADFEDWERCSDLVSDIY